jgi:hypothetical protein
MKASVAVELGADSASGDKPTVPLWRDDDLLEMHQTAPKPAPGSCIVRIEARSSHRTRVGAVAFALAGLGLALVGSVVLRSRSSSRKVARPAAPRLAHPRRSAGGSHALHAAERRPRPRLTGAHLRGNTSGRPRAGASKVRRPSSLARPGAAPEVEFTTPRPPAPRPVSAPQRRGEEFGFER